MKRKRIISAALGVTLAMSAFSGFAGITAGADEAVVYKQTPRIMEELNRGLIAAYSSAAAIPTSPSSSKPWGTT